MIASSPGTPAGTRIQDERTALLVRQVYFFNQRSQDEVLEQSDDTLRAVLSRPYFQRVPRGHEDRVGTVAFGPGGTTLASASNDGTLRLWDLHSPEAAGGDARPGSSV